MKTMVQRLRAWSPRDTAGVVCLALALFLTVNALMSMRAALELLDTRDRIAQAHEVIEQLQSVEALIKDANMEARAYALTGEAAFLEPHKAAVARIQNHLRILRVMMASDPDPLERLPEFERMVEKKLDVLTRQIDLQESDGRQAAAHAIASGAGRYSMDEIRRVLMDMERTERATVDRRKAQATEATKVASLTFIAVNVTALVVMVLAYFVVLAYMRRRERTQEQIQRAYSELEARVRERTADLAEANDELNRDIALRKKMAAEREEIVQKMMEALAEVKKLSGLLPICARCKSIRDDQGYWKQIEAYLIEHSDAEFSHGLCPHCAAELYPEMYEAKTPSV
ncbi:MAG TPA: CHASE3 domain-containing protein [Kiritimatiellia bacterium]